LLSQVLGAQSPAVSERRLDNGVRVLLAPRPGCGAVHAAWFFGGGRRSDGAAEAADDLLAAWFFVPGCTCAGAAGAPGFWAGSCSGGVASGRDITAEGLEEWCSAELLRICGPLGRERLEAAQGRRQGQDPLREMERLALGPTPQARPDIAIEAIRSTAKSLVAPEEALVVLVGDMEEAPAMKVLDAHFGRLAPSGATGAGAAGGANGAPPPGARRRQIPSAAKTEVLVAWKVPQELLHQSGALGDALEVFAEMLAGRADAGLAGHLVGELGCSGGVQVAMGAAGLFAIRADVKDGHAAAEVENAIQGGVRAALKKGLDRMEVGRAAHRLETKRAARLADASGLASALIDAFASSGDWRRAMWGGRQLDPPEPEEMAAFLRQAFPPDGSFALTAERDLSQKSQEHARMASLVSRLLAKNGADPGEGGTLIKETLRQFDQMPAEMRRGTLALLEAAGAPPQAAGALPQAPKAPKATDAAPATAEAGR